MERYTRVFTLPEKGYTEGSPVLIVAGAILKDNQTQRILAQLKFQNIQEKRIKALKVLLTPFDTVGRALGESVEYQYLDLSISRDEEFGQKTPIPLPDVTTRSFSAQVVSVAFADNSVWESTGEWISIPEQERLSLVLDWDLKEQYQRDFGTDKNFVPKKVSDLWFCGCGAVNHQEETACHCCQSAYTRLTEGLDPGVLAGQIAERIAKEEQRKAEEEAVKAKLQAEEEARKAKLQAEKEARKQETIKIITRRVAPIAAVVIVVALVLTQIVIPNIQHKAAYEEATALYEDGQYQQALFAFQKAGDYKDAMEYTKELLPYLPCMEHSVSAGDSHTVGLKSDGTVVATGSNEKSQCNVIGWKDIVAVSAGFSHTVGLKSNGTVVAVGKNGNGQCDVSGWKEIVAVSAGSSHTVGLKSDGTVVATGSNINGQCDVSGWKEIVAVSAGSSHTVGLKSDGTVVTVGQNGNGQCDVSGWKDIVAISAGASHTVGLMSDGTVVAVGYNGYGQCDVSDWTDIVAVSAGGSHTVGLKSDGTVVATGDNAGGQCDVGGWKDIVAVSAGSDHTVGLKSDGTVVAVGSNGDCQRNVSGWSGLRVP